MKLTRLRLLGFKSFVEPTDFLIEPGLTGVVGPNGCGKSNLVEALRWVMGETSHKSMRAAEMDDVIFSGTNNRPARNTAEVSIRIDNSKHEAPAQFNEHDTLDISRRIEREKGSVYRINGNDVRARDVMTVFADASTGSRSPALVHQGRIGEIIQAKPEQRRRVLEEAAGISGLHQRRNEAELRLRAAEQNLLRVEDVVTQLAGQMDALKRQARQAIRYRVVAADIRKAEATLFHLRWVNAQTEIGDAERAKDLSVRAVADATIAQTETGKARDEAAVAVPPLRDAEVRAGAALQRLVSARDALDQEEMRARERLAELERRLVQLAEDVQRERALVGDAEATLQRLVSEEETLKQEVQGIAQTRTGVDERVSAAEQALTATEATFGKLTGALADLTAMRNQLTGTIRDQEERVVRIEAEIGNIEAGLAAAAQSNPDLAALAASLQTAQSAIATADRAATEAEAAHAAAREELDAARGPLTDAERTVQRLETEAKTLMKLLAVETQNMWPPVMDRRHGGERLREGAGCRARRRSRCARRSVLADALDGRGGRADRSGSAAGRRAAVAARHRSARTGAPPRADRRGRPRRCRKPRCRMLKPGQRLVSREGDLWRWDGFAADAHAPTGAARRLAERGRLADIDGELATARAQLRR